MKRYLLLMLPLALAACTKPAQDATPAATAEPAAAAAVETPPVDAGASLPGYHWQLTDAKGADGKRIDGLFVRADSPVQLDFADGRVSVSNTCNRMSGGYTLEADKLTFTPMASTMMACPDGKAHPEFVPVVGEGFMLRYNSKLPIVVYVPKDIEVRYRIWSASKQIKQAVSE